MLIKKIAKYFLLSLLLIPLFAICDVINVEDESEFDSYLSKGPVIVDFHGESFCAPCQRVAGPYKDLSGKYENVTFLKVDAQKLSKLSGKYKVGGLPTFITFKDGKQDEFIVGGNLAKIEEAIQKITSSSAPKTKAKPVEKPKTKPAPTKAKPNGKSKVKGGALVTIDSKEKLDEIIQSGKSAVIEIEKTTCQFCKFTKVPLETLASRYPDVVFSIINKDEVKGVEEEYQDKVKGYPTFLVFKDGQLVTAFTGATGDEEKNLKIFESKINVALGNSTGGYVLKSESEIQSERSAESPKRARKPVVKKAKKIASSRRRISPANPIEAMPHCSTGCN